MPVTTTGGANLSLVEEELNSQEKTQGPHFQRFYRLHPPFVHAAMDPQETIWAIGLLFEPTWRSNFSHKHSKVGN